MPDDPVKAAPLLPEIELELFAALKPVTASPERASRLRNRIDAAIGSMVAAEPAVVTCRLEEGPWIPGGQDYEIKIVSRDRETGLCSYLLRLSANGSIPAHLHHSTEECVILSGEVEVGGVTLRAGDYQMLQAGTRHARIFSQQGALLFLRSALPVAA